MEYRTIIYNAARDGNLRRLKVFLDGRSPEDVKSLLSAKTFGTPPLVIAARNGHVDVVRYLVEGKKADVGVTGSVSFDGETIEGAPPLWAAAAAGNLEIVRILVDNEAEVNQRTVSNSTPLRGACFDGHLDIVQYLVEHGADMEIPNRHGHTCLMIASYRRQTPVVKFLLDAGANVNKASLKGNTALHDAAEAGSLEILQMLLARRAEMQRDAYGLTPLLSAAGLGHSQVVEFLVEHPLCSLWEKVEGLQLLGSTAVDKRRDLGAAVNCWRRALALATETGLSWKPVNEPISAYAFQKEVRSLDDLERLVGDPDALRMQALLIRERILGPAHADTIYYLRYRGAIYADVGRFDRCIELWMHALCMQQSTLEPLSPMTQGTLVSFAELFAYMLNDYLSAHRNPGGPSPPGFDHVFAVLEVAVDEVSRGLAGALDPEPDPDHQDPLHRLCVVSLHLVCLLWRLETETSAEQAFRLHCLLYRLVRMEPRDQSGQTLLHLCCSVNTTTVGRFPVCRFPSLNVCQLLLEVGAEPNALDALGSAPLHVIVSNRVARPSIVRCLLERGAHIDQRSLDGHCPLDTFRRPDSDVAVGEYLSLKCLAAAAVKKYGIAFRKCVPRGLLSFVEVH